MDVLITAAQFILSLSILIVLHELGHFIPAKLFKTKVEKFYLFFDPYFSIFKKKIGDTEYGIGWVPLGGYVKIAGMIDESMDTEQMEKEPQPWEFRSKPAWQRLIIMIGGVVVNVLLSIFIYAMIVFTWGDKFLPTDNAVYGIQCGPVAKEIGFQDGDKILTVDGQKEYNFNLIPEMILVDGVKQVTVDRNGSKEVIEIPADLVDRVISSRKPLLSFGLPFIVDKFGENSVAEKAGLQKGDQLIALNGEKMILFSEYVKNFQENKGKEVKLTVLREGKAKQFAMTLSADGKIGVYPNSAIEELFDIDVKHYSFFGSFSVGYEKMTDRLNSYLKQMKLILNPDSGAYKGVGGFISIAKIFDSGVEWDWEQFWANTAFLSIVLAFMNILPIPALDGGHVMFLLYEMVSGRKPGDKFMEYAQYTGLIILLSLLVFANGNDVIGLFR